MPPLISGHMSINTSLSSAAHEARVTRAETPLSGPVRGEESPAVAGAVDSGGGGWEGREGWGEAG